MGKTIERMAAGRGHEILLKVTDNIASQDLSGVDIAIDFSVPQAAFTNITSCFEKGVPVVSGTTGWLDQYEAAAESCRKHDSAFIYASNFSLGVNIFFELNKKLAEMMGNFPQYSPSIEEIHHTQKLDAPSGTALTLAQQILEKSSKTAWTLETPKEEELPITAKRIEAVPGTHVVTYASAIDTINIEHIAHSRDGFALGAVIAAECLLNKKGVFSMKDVLF